MRRIGRALRLRIHTDPVGHRRSDAPRSRHVARAMHLGSGSRRRAVGRRVQTGGAFLRGAVCRRASLARRRMHRYFRTPTAAHSKASLTPVLAYGWDATALLPRAGALRINVSLGDWMGWPSQTPVGSSLPYITAASRRCCTAYVRCIFPWSGVPAPRRGSPTSVAAVKGMAVRCVTAPRSALLRSQLIYWSLCSRTRR